MKTLTDGNVHHYFMYRAEKRCYCNYKKSPAVAYKLKMSKYENVKKQWKLAIFPASRLKLNMHRPLFPRLKTKSLGEIVLGLQHY